MFFSLQPTDVCPPFLILVINQHLGKGILRLSIQHGWNLPWQIPLNRDFVFQDPLNEGKRIATCALSRCPILSLFICLVYLASWASPLPAAPQAVLHFGKAQVRQGSSAHRGCAWGAHLPGEIQFHPQPLFICSYLYKGSLHAPDSV